LFESETSSLILKKEKLRVFENMVLRRTQRIEEKSFAPAGDRTPIARSSSPQSNTILTELTRLP
jgi:hypothetical protein